MRKSLDCLDWCVSTLHRSFYFFFELTPSSAPSLLPFKSVRGADLLSGLLLSHLHHFHSHVNTHEPTPSRPHPAASSLIVQYSTGYYGVKIPSPLRLWNLYCREEGDCSVKHKNIWLADRLTSHCRSLYATVSPHTELKWVFKHTW